jgi:asparagine synthase (glutamine-hydrolysing)
MAPMSERTSPLFGYAGVSNRADQDSLVTHADRLAAAGAGAASRERAAAAFATGPGVAVDGDVTVAIEGSPILDWSAPELRPPAAARAIIDTYRKHGARFLEHVHGGFALALIDGASRTTFIAVDRMGIERMAYAASSRGIVFSSSARAVAESELVSGRLQPQALFDYLMLHIVPSPASVYDGVAKLRAGTFARFEAGRVTIERYWQPQFVEAQPVPEDELAAEIKQGVRAGVAACSPGAHSGAFLSGGLDSSSVAGMLCAVLERAAPTFSIGFGVDAFNEIEYARLANRRFGATAHEYEVTPEDVVSAFPRIAAAYDEPFGNSSAVPTYFCARLARDHGVPHLLAGDGGDEIFGGNERYARQKVFEIYHSIPRLLRTGLIEPLTRPIPPESRLTPLRKLRSYVDQARIPMPERLETWNFMYRADLGEMLEPEFRASIDPRSAFRGMAEVYSSSACKSLTNKMLFYDWQYTLADNDLRKVGAMCALAGVRVSYPMLHPRLIDVSLRIPPALKVQGLNLRALYKRAMADFLPKEIITKTKHGFGLPFGQWLKTHAKLGELIYSYLTDLKQRRIVRGAFLDKLIDDHRTGHPSYFGYAIWDFAMLEAWFQARSVVSTQRA